MRLDKKVRTVELTKPAKFFVLAGTRRIKNVGNPVCIQEKAKKTRAKAQSK